MAAAARASRVRSRVKRRRRQQLAQVACRALVHFSTSRYTLHAMGQRPPPLAPRVDAITVAALGTVRV